MLTVWEWRRLIEKYFTEMKTKRSREMLFVNVAEVVLYFEERKFMLSLIPESPQIAISCHKNRRVESGKTA